MRYLVAGLSVTIFLCNGCATVDPAARSAIGHSPLPPVSTEMVPRINMACDQKELPKLRVGSVIGGRETNYFRGTRINNEDFANAIKSTLAVTSLLDDEDISEEGGLEIRAYLVDTSHSLTTYGILKPETVMANLMVSYRIIDINTNNILWQEEFTATSTAHYLDSESNWNILSQKAYEGAARENLKLLSAGLCNKLIAISKPPSDGYDEESPVGGSVNRDKPLPWPDNINEDASKVRINVGSFAPDKNTGEFTDRGNGLSLGLGITNKLDLSEYMAFDFDTMFISRNYDTTIPPPLFGQIDDSMTLETLTLMGGLRFYYPSSGKFHVYANGGVGLFLSKLMVSGTTFGLPGSIEEHDHSLGWFAGAGMSLDIKDSVLAVDYIQLYIEGSFGDFGLSNVDIGGEYIGLSYGMYY